MTEPRNDERIYAPSPPQPPSESDALRALAMAGKSKGYRVAVLTFDQPDDLDAFDHIASRVSAATAVLRFVGAADVAIASAE